MMMGFGFLLMLAVIAVPMLLLAGLLILMVKPGVVPGNAPPAATPGNSASAAAVCSHCGAKLQPEWLHCPQCGAPA